MTIHSDRGPEFRSHIVRHTLEMLEIHQTYTTPYRPQSDGFVERFNRTLKEMLSVATNDNPLAWVDRLPFCMMAYNATTQASTGCMPNILCFGEELSMPVDIMFGSRRDKRPFIRPDGSINYHAYVEYKRNNMLRGFESSRKVQRKAAIRQQRGYNTHLKPRMFSPGDWVLKWYKPAADRPLGRGWIGPYVVVRVRGDVVFEIQSHPNSTPHTVHVDHLKHCYAFEGKDNWIINPDFVPAGPPKTNQKDTDMGLDDILSQEGEDALDREALLQDLRQRLPHPVTPVARNNGSTPLKGRVDRSPPADTSIPLAGTPPCSASPGPGKGDGQSVSDGLTSPMATPTASGDPSPVPSVPHAEPKVTRRGRAIVPPKKYADFDMATCRAKLKGRHPKMQVKFSF